MNDRIRSQICEILEEQRWPPIDTDGPKEQQQEEHPSRLEFVLTVFALLLATGLILYALSPVLYLWYP